MTLNYSMYTTLKFPKGIRTTKDHREVYIFRLATILASFCNENKLRRCMSVKNLNHNPWKGRHLSTYRIGIKSLAGL